MTIGVSLPVEFLAGIGTSEDTEHLRTAFGDADKLLTRFGERGVGAIEIKSMHADTPAEAVLMAYSKVRSSGMTAALHGFLPVPPISDAITEYYATYAGLMEQLRGADTPLTMIVHALRDPVSTIENNRTRTNRVMWFLEQVFSDLALPVSLALEINRDHGRPDASYTYQGVIDMLVLTRAGICFDFGHTCWNSERHGLASEPPAEFLKRTVHTHIHDIGANGTHYPLSEGHVPVADYVRLLQGAGYAGIFNLELAPHRFAAERDVAEAYDTSIDILKGMV